MSNRIIDFFLICERFILSNAHSKCYTDNRTDIELILFLGNFLVREKS